MSVADLPLDEWIGQALGAASMCWSDVSGAGEFDSVRCAWVFDGLMAHVRAVVDAVIAGVGRASAGAVWVPFTPDEVVAILDGDDAAAAAAVRSRNARAAALGLG